MDIDLDLNLPFLTRQFRDAGGDPGNLRRREYQQIVRNVWIRRSAYDHDALYRAALLLHPPTAYLSRLTAASLLAAPVPDHPFVHVTVSREKDRRFRPQIKPHVSTRPRQIVVVRGMRLTHPIDTFIDCAGTLSFVDLVILGDALCKMHRIPAAELRRSCQASGAYYSGLARRAAAYVRDGVDSAMETRLRLLIVLAGLPEPVVNFIVRWDDGAWKRRYDLCYPEIKLVVDYDGRQHADDPRQWHIDIERREEMDDGGYRMLVVTAEGIYRRPEHTLQRVRRQLVLRGMPNVPAINEAWRAHFAA